MKGVRFSVLRKKYPKEAKKLMLDQEIAVLFLNSPYRERWMDFIKIKKADKRKIEGVAEHYGKLKIKEENKRKPKLRKEVIKIEDLCLQKVFRGEVIKLGHVLQKDMEKVAKKILATSYKGSVILDVRQLDELATIIGINGIKRNFPTDFLVFDPKGKKIISVEVIVE